MGVRDFPILGRRAANDAIWLKFARRDRLLTEFPVSTLWKSALGSPVLMGPILPVQTATVGLVPRRWQSPAAQVRGQINGVSRDSTGVALGLCTVMIFETQRRLLVHELISNADGTWSWDVMPGLGPFFYVEYLIGSPDRAGTSLNTNVPAVI